MFSKEAWARNGGIYDAICTMPFNRELAEGTLSLTLFRHYMVQDAHYLVAFAQALALAAAKADEPERIVQFARSAATAIEVERELHTDYFHRFGLTSQDVTASPPTPVAHHYISFLLATGFREPVAVHVAAMLPCFWIYREVGRSIHGRAAPGNPYQAWIDTYAGEEFATAVDAMIDATDAFAAQADSKTVEAMHATFKRACQLEWMFWDSAYRDAEWPIA